MKQLENAVLQMQAARAEYLQYSTAALAALDPSPVAPAPVQTEPVPREPAAGELLGEPSGPPIDVSGDLAVGATHQFGPLTNAQLAFRELAKAEYAVLQAAERLFGRP